MTTKNMQSLDWDSFVKEIEPMPVIERKLFAAARAGHNVLLEGDHGTGKTRIARSVLDTMFGRDNVVWLNGSMLDAYVDVVGIPVDGSKFDEEVKARVMSFLRPYWHHNIRALFIDEINRAPVAVLNALMSITLDGTVNNEKTDLEFVIAAMNPHSTTDKAGRQKYAVQEMDAAMMDRFPVRLTMLKDFPIQYFETTFGAEMASDIVTWWNSLKKEVRDDAELSPRRVEQAIEVFNSGFPVLDVADTIPASCQPAALQRHLQKYSITKIWSSAVKNNNTDEIARLVNGTHAAAVRSLLTEEQYPIYLEHVDPDRLTSVLFDADPDIATKFANLRIENDTVREALVEAAHNLPQINDAHKALVKAFVRNNTDGGVDQATLDSIATEYGAPNASDSKWEKATFFQRINADGTTVRKRATTTTKKA